MESKSRINSLIYIILAVIAFFMSIWGIYEYNEKKKLKTELENQYSRAFYEMADYVDDIETELRKGMLVKSPAHLASISGKIYMLSNSAKSCLGQLPISEIELDNTEKFLSQVGDYTYVLSQGKINGEEINDAQYKEIEKLTEYAENLNVSIEKIKNAVNDGNLSFTDEKRKNTVSAAGSFMGDFEMIEKSFDEYPSLIYDGPFSEHMENRRSPIINASKEISLESAKKIAAEFLKNSEENVIFEGETKNTAIDAYNFYVNFDTRENISISKKGGFVIYFLKNREVTDEKLGFEEAVNLGGEYLKLHGFESMKNSYYDKTGGVATVNFAYEQDGVTCYSDLIKVKVALDNGEILGMEANGYLMNHSKRNFENIKLTKEDANNKISKHLKIQNSSLALIPKDSLREVLCYEIKGCFKEKNYIIYINAQNGREEKILMLLESENGILTV